MRQEDIEILIRDLCARLPYGVIVETPKGKGHVCDINLTIFGYEFGVNVNPTIRDNFSINDVKPYLFPMSSMTDEEKLMYEGLMIGTDNISYMLDVYRKDMKIRGIKLWEIIPMNTGNSKGFIISLYFTHIFVDW